MNTFSGPTLDSLLTSAYPKLLEAHTTIPSSKGSNRELTGVVFELSNPLARVSRSYLRGVLFSAVGELAWYLAGSDRKSFINNYLPSVVYEGIDRFGHLRGAYGPRLRGSRHNDQISSVIELLKQKPNTRQAVIQLFDRRDLYHRIPDLPCTCTIQFILRDNALSAFTYMRSNDAYRGLPHDIYCFTMIQELIARSIGADLGSYQHFVGSLHIYEKDAEGAQNYLREGVHAEREHMTQMPEGDPWAEVKHLLRWERQTRRRTTQLSGTLLLPATYWGDLARVISARHTPKEDSDALKQIAQSLSDPFFKSYILDRSYR